MALLSMSRSVSYELIRSGRLRSVKQGRTRLIPENAISDYVALLERETHGRAADIKPKRRRGDGGVTWTRTASGSSRQQRWDIAGREADRPAKW
jgi:excisionase family DNA binding protein